MNPSLPSTPGRRELLSLHGAVLAAAAVLLVALGVATWLTLAGAYRDEVQRALRDSERSAQKLAVHVMEALDHVDRTTLLAKALHETGNPMSLTGLRHAGLVELGLTRAVLRTDGKGRVEDSTAADMALSLSDDDDFKRHKRYNDLGLTLGLPQPDHLNGGWVIPAMRALSRPDASFDGVVVVMVDPAALTRDFDGGEAPGTAVGVIGLDNIYRARLVDGKLTHGERVDAQKVLQRSREMRETLEPSISPIDGRQRFVTALPVDRHALVALVAVSADGVLAAYRQTRLRVLAWSTAIALLVLGGAAGLWYQVQRLDASRRAEREAKALYVATLDGSLDALWLLRAERDATGTVTDFSVTDGNRRAAAVLGLPRDIMLGQRASALVPSMRDGGMLDLLKRVMVQQAPFDVETPGIAPQVRGRWLHYQIVPVDDGVALIMRDITDRKQAERQLADMARHDALTGLPNRRHFEEQLGLAVARAQRSQQPLALVYLDLDGFKHVNDTLGHEAGDRLLIEVARRLKAKVRETDLVARLGGDEFTVILENAGQADDRLQQCERLVAALSQPHALAGRTVVSTPSLGLAVHEYGEDAESLRRRADAAMYQAKHAGKACVRMASSAASDTPA